MKGLRLVCLVLVASPGLSLGQGGLLKLSPGPLSQSHARWDDVGPGCLRCHQLTGAVNGSECLTCHAVLKRSIDSKSGLHAKFEGRCVKCHTEHKGRDAPITDWKEVGQGASFDHARTGFTLAGSHGSAKCSACHKRRTASGGTLYAGLSPTCTGCHPNPHDFTRRELQEQCLSCHPVGGVSARKMRPSQIPFDHGQATEVPLIGKHADVPCVKCHRGAKMSQTALRTCGSCHKDRHGKTYARKPCASCHQPSRPFARVEFDHARTAFPTEGLHQEVRCRECHRDPSRAPAKECGSCHRATHRTRFGAMQCSQCHQEGSSKLAFDHATLTRFPLTNRHAVAKCRSCHRGDKPWKFEKVATACADCHRHQKAHLKGTFREKPCTECHASGARKLVLDHNQSTRFPLTGLHARLLAARRCAACHPSGSYKTGKLACHQCHKDRHKGSLGNECQRCHSTEVKFAKGSFDHTRAAFPLEGAHQKVKCEACHPNKEYRLGKTRCADCHAKTDPHAGKQGNACERCHRPEKGAPLFVHQTMTPFRLEGAHREVACSLCHRAAPSQGPPQLGKAGPPPPLDRGFPLMGRTCAACHADPHAGRNGPACEGCHKVSSFQEVSAAVHDRGPFRLGGIHATLPCQSCHGGQRLLAGTGEDCQSCHRDDDAHRNALGPSCGECHGQQGWRPARFNHTQTGFELRGAHRRAGCPDCHGVGSFSGRPTQCEGCHQDQALRVVDPLHTPQLGACEDCHSETHFAPARLSHPEFPLEGRHLRIGCRNCHPGGRYAGTPDACESCHLSSYQDPATRPNHRAALYPLSCADCHSPSGWIPARAP